MYYNYDKASFSYPAYSITQFYPYFVNTGLFEGFEPRMRFILPTLDANYVVQRMYSAIMAEEEDVYIRSIIYYLKIVIMILPMRI